MTNKQDRERAEANKLVQMSTKPVYACTSCTFSTDNEWTVQTHALEEHTCQHNKQFKLTHDYQETLEIEEWCIDCFKIFQTKSLKDLTQEELKKILSLVINHEQKTSGEKDASE